MPLIMGIDLGTSSVKIIIMDEDGKVLASDSAGYPLHRDGWNNNRKIGGKLFVIRSNPLYKYWKKTRNIITDKISLACQSRAK